MFCKWTILTVIAGILTTSCTQRSVSGKDLDLLTATPWRYEKAGFDNDDGTFNALDPSIGGNERDNIIIFCKDGTGYSQLSHQGRNGNPDSLPFIWAFQKGDSIIYFQDQYYKVRELSPHRFEIYADEQLGRSNTRYTIILRR
ncbi:MAG TPA: hypothetical protein VG605_15490 [Puia sp.]|jgi:hypothetical protein|nr:hypothetical protein [Puia sp.]